MLLLYISTRSIDSVHLELYPILSLYKLNQHYILLGLYVHDKHKVACNCKVEWLHKKNNFAFIQSHILLISLNKIQSH